METPCFLQCAKQVVSSSPGLVDFTIGLVIFVLYLSDGQVLFILFLSGGGGDSNYRRIVNNPVDKKGFWG